MQRIAKTLSASGNFVLLAPEPKVGPCWGLCGSASRRPLYPRSHARLPFSSFWMHRWQLCQTLSWRPCLTLWTIFFTHSEFLCLQSVNICCSTYISWVFRIDNPPSHTFSFFFLYLFFVSVCLFTTSTINDDSSRFLRYLLLFFV